MGFEVQSPELREVQDTSLEIMRAARARTAHLKYDALALKGGREAINSRKEDLVERLNKDRLVQMEAMEIQMLPPQSEKVTTKPKKVTTKPRRQKAR